MFRVEASGGRQPPEEQRTSDDSLALRGLTPPARQDLAERQTALMRALTDGTPAPTGFDVGRVEASAAALLSKRVRAAARAWPALARSLGDDFAPRFRDFARTTPRPGEGGPLADGRAFARELDALTDEARLEVLAVDLYYTAHPDGLTPRRGPVCKVAWLREAGRLVLACRLPLLGNRWLVLPLRPRRVW